MDPSHVLNQLRDPAGVPAHPVIFQVLMVLTWVAHIAFVHLALGTAGLAIYGFHRRAQGNRWARFSIAMTQVAKVSISLLIVMGVAPLLFTQVIYDPEWYASNVLSGRWVIAFIFTLIVAYCLWFAFYYANRDGARRHAGWFAWFALALFCLDGLIMHVLSFQALLPGQWMSWYAPGGAVDMSGAGLHAIQWPRYLFIMSLSAPMAGLFSMAYARYFEQRSDFEPEYRDFVVRIGSRTASVGFAASFFLLLAWQFDLPARSGLVSNPVGWILAASIAAMVYTSMRRGPALHGYLQLAGGLVVLTVLALWREIIRIAYLRPFGYSIGDYPVHYDPSMVLFFLTLAGIGGVVGGFFLTLLYKSGRVAGRYTADRAVARLGTAAVATLAVWMVAFFVYGILIWVRNSFVA